MTPTVSTALAPVRVNCEAYSRKYQDCQQKNSQELAEIRRDRTESPFWNTFKEVPWVATCSFFQLGQAIGSFVGHAVVFGIVGVFSVGVGICAATFMKGVDFVTGRDNQKTFLDYIVTTVQLACNLAYNRASDFFCLYILGPTLLITVVEPLLFLAVVAGVTAAVSPLIYRDLANNNCRNVENFEKLLKTPVSTAVNNYIWGPFLDSTGDDFEQGMIRPFRSFTQGVIDVSFLPPISRCIQIDSHQSLICDERGSNEFANSQIPDLPR